MSKLLCNKVIHLNNINLKFILKLTLFLLFLLFIHPFLLPRSVNVLILVTRKPRRRRKGRRRRSQISKPRNQANIVMNVDNVKKLSNKPRKVKFPCMLWKGDHLLGDCPGILQVLEVWSMGSHHPLLSAFADHVGDKPSTRNNKVHGKKGKIKFPYRFCEGNHQIHLCLYMDEASKVLESLISSQQQLPTC